MNKNWKKVTAVTSGALLLGASLMGAAANLGNLPEPFVGEDGTPNVQFVIGSGSTEDYLGVVDIATMLQAHAVTEETVATPGTGTSVSVEGGYNMAVRSSLYLNDSIANIRDSLRDTHLPNLLADGVIDVDGSDYDTTQRLTFNTDNSAIVFDTVDREPAIYLDLTEDNWVWNYTVRIDTFNMTELEGSEVIEMLGKPFTFAPASQTDSGTVKLFGSDVTTFVELNEPVTVESNGQSYTIEVVGGNSDDSNIILDVNGDRRTLKDGESRRVGGIDIYVKDLFVTNIPTLSASANIFVGSEEIVLEDGQDVEIGGDSIRGLKAHLDLTGDELSEIAIQYNPRNLRGDVDDFDRIEEVFAGESLADPLFGTFEVLFSGMSYDLDDSAKSMVSFEQRRDELEFTFTNNEGNEISFMPYALNGGVPGLYWAAEQEGYNGAIANGTSMTEDQIIILQEDDADFITKVYLVDRVEDDGADSYVELRDLGSNRVISVDLNEQVGNARSNSTGTWQNVVVTSVSGTNFNLSHNTSDVVYLEGGKQYVRLNASHTYIAEVDVPTNVDRAVAALQLGEDDGDITVRVNTSALTGPWLDATSRAEDEAYFLSVLGTYIVEDDDDQQFVRAYVPQDKDMAVEFNVFVAPQGAQTTTTGTAGGSVTTERVNRIPVGAALLDTEVNLANPSSNLVVVGGPCINSVAAELLGVAAGSCGEASGLSPNTAVIELFTLDNGRVAMLVAGWEAQDTRAAARAVATRDDGLSGNSASLSVTSATNYQVQ